MNAKVTKVVLVCPRHNLKQNFEMSHAERLLMMADNGGWQLPEETIFDFDITNGLRIKRNKRSDKQPVQEAGD